MSHPAAIRRSAFPQPRPPVGHPHPLDPGEARHRRVIALVAAAERTARAPESHLARARLREDLDRLGPADELRDAVILEATQPALARIYIDAVTALAAATSDHAATSYAVLITAFANLRWRARQPDREFPMRADLR